MRRSKPPPPPSLSDVKNARRVFAVNEARDVFYTVASYLIKVSDQGGTEVSLAQGLAVLLMTWNQAFYRYKRFDAAHLDNLEGLLRDGGADLNRYRKRSLVERLDDADEGPVKTLFERFESLLGPVGAAKCLHLLAPAFFPIWDREIAGTYGPALAKRGQNADRYWRFTKISADYAKRLAKDFADPLKALDEYNHCKYKQRWRLEA